MEFIDNISSKESTQINIDICEKNTEVTKRKFQTWSKKEDIKLLELYAKSPEKWNIISSLMENRNQNQCLHRYLRLSKSDKHLKVWTTIEDELALKLIKDYGKNWKIISEKMGTKTGKQIKQKFNTMMDVQMQIKFKQQSCIINNKQKILTSSSKLSTKSPKFSQTRLNNLYNVYSSQKTISQSLISDQCKQKPLKQSVKTSKFYSQQMKNRCRHQSHFVYDSEIEYANTINRLKNDRQQPDFRDLNCLISKSQQINE